MIKILAIDDKEDNLISLKAILKDVFPEALVFTALSGLKGIEQAASEDPDVILLDIVMPGMDGFEVCRRLKQDTLLMEIPVVFLTALKESKENRLLALEAGAEAFLSKPIDITELTAQLRVMLKIRAVNISKRNEQTRLEALVKSRTEALEKELEKTHKAEAALKESNERFFHLFERAPLGYQSLDANGHFIEVNQAWLKALGYKREDVIGKWFGDFLAPEFVEAYRKRFTIFIAQGKIHSEFEMLHSNGEPKFIAFDGRISHKEDGSFDKTHCILNDITERKLAEKALIESESKYRLMFENNPQPMWIYDHGTLEILEVNNAAIAHYGYTREEFVSMTLKDIRPQEDVALMLEDVELSRQQKHNTGQGRHLKKNGEVIVVEINAYSIRFNNRDARHVLIKDITEHKQAEALLLEANQKLEAFFNQSLDGFFFMMLDKPIEWNEKADKEKLMLDTFSQQRITKVNDAWLKQYGATRELFIGFTPADMFKHDIETGIALWRKLFDDGKLHTEADGYKLTGEHMYIEGDYTCLYDSKGRITGHFGVQRDVTESKHANETILKLSKAIEQSPSTIVITDVLGNIEYVNPKFSEITGYTPEEVIGENPRILKSGEMPAGAYKELWDTISSDGVWHGEFHNRRKNGELYWEWASITSIKNEKGVITNYIAIKEDISIRKTMEADLIAAKEKAEENEEKYKQIFDNTFDIMSVYEVTEDNRFKVITFNHAEANLIGNLENFQNRYIDECIPSELYNQFTQHYERCIKEGKRIEYEEHISFLNINNHSIRN